jgi:hypothetical protein
MNVVAGAVLQRQVEMTILYIVEYKTPTIGG